MSRLLLVAGGLVAAVVSAYGCAEWKTHEETAFEDPRLVKSLAELRARYASALVGPELALQSEGNPDKERSALVWENDRLGAERLRFIGARGVKYSTTVK